MSGRTTRSRSAKHSDVAVRSSPSPATGKLSAAFTQRKLNFNQQTKKALIDTDKKSSVAKRLRDVEDDLKKVDLTEEEEEEPQDVKKVKVVHEIALDSEPETETEVADESVPAYIRTLVTDKAAVIQYLKAFDLNLTYGPCVGLSRMERWERAHKLELDPPEDVKLVLQTREAMSDVDIREPLWHKEL
ncbi:DNA polymerase delta, subunit 4-domain-containing protein [Powellomyces hirtus]|nr:DNA polymerase delta, subunit 4-domain-containing protein [Powellomyces hirtus]